MPYAEDVNPAGPSSGGYPGHQFGQAYPGMAAGYPGQPQAYPPAPHLEALPSEGRDLLRARIAVNVAAIAIDMFPTALDPETFLAVINTAARVPFIAKRIPGSRLGTWMQAIINSTPDVHPLFTATATAQEAVDQVVPSALFTRVWQIWKDRGRLRELRERAAQSAPPFAGNYPGGRGHAPRIDPDL